MSVEEPIGVMACFECVEKHSRDLEHHLEDIIRVAKDPRERLYFEDLIDKVREIRKFAHQRAKGIAVAPPVRIPILGRVAESSNSLHVRYIDLETGKTLEKTIPDREQYDLYKLQGEGKISIIEIHRVGNPEWEEVEKRALAIVEAGKKLAPEPKPEVEYGEHVWVERNVAITEEECHPESFRVIKPNPEHIITICCPLDHWDEQAKRCLVGTRAYKIEHLHPPEESGSCPVCQG